jgi:hypothetical protein
MLKVYVLMLRTMIILVVVEQYIVLEGCDYDADGG